MKTNKEHRFEKILYAGLAMVFGVGLGFYWAAATAAEHVLAGLK